jgi:hypothetical protein
MRTGWSAWGLAVTICSGSPVISFATTEFPAPTIPPQIMHPCSWAVPPVLKLLALSCCCSARLVLRPGHTNADSLLQPTSSPPHSLVTRLSLALCSPVLDSEGGCILCALVFAWISAVAQIRPAYIAYFVLTVCFYQNAVRQECMLPCPELGLYIYVPRAMIFVFCPCVLPKDFTLCLSSASSTSLYAWAQGIRSI